MLSVFVFAGVDVFTSIVFFQHTDETEVDIVYTYGTDIASGDNFHEKNGSEFPFV